MREKMTHVDWRPYPEEKPKKSGYYFLSFPIGTIGGNVGLSFFDKGLGEFEYNDCLAIAWAEIDYPDPYRQIKKKSRRKHEQL